MQLCLLRKRDGYLIERYQLSSLETELSHSQQHLIASIDVGQQHEPPGRYEPGGRAL